VMVRAPPHLRPETRGRWKGVASTFALEKHGAPLSGARLEPNSEIGAPKDL